MLFGMCMLAMATAARAAALRAARLLGFERVLQGRILAPADTEGVPLCCSIARHHVQHAAVRNCADGRAIGSLEDMKEAAVSLHALGPQWVLVKVTTSKSYLPAW